MNHRSVGIDDLLGTLSAAAAADRATATAEQRRQTLRDLVAPFPVLAEPAVRTVERVSLGPTLVRERIVLEVLPGVEFSAYVFGPANPAGRLPAVLAIHGHGYGSRQISGLRPDGSPDTDDTDGHHHFALALAERGLVVIAPDVLGFGERVTDTDRSFDPESSNACYRLAETLLLTGHSLVGVRVAELLGTVRHLRSRPEVDPARIGVMGHSGGSLLAMVTLACDDDLTAGVLCGYPNTFGDSILRVRHCACNYLPGILRVADQPELLALTAPRPLFVESGTRDPIFPLAGFHRAVAVLRQTYAAAGVPDRLGVDEHPGAHEVSGRVSFDWLAHQLTSRRHEVPASQGEAR